MKFHSSRRWSYRTYKPKFPRARRANYSDGIGPPPLPRIRSGADFLYRRTDRLFPPDAPDPVRPMRIDTRQHVRLTTHPESKRSRRINNWSDLRFDDLTEVELGMSPLRQFSNRLQLSRRGRILSYDRSSSPVLFLDLALLL